MAFWLSAIAITAAITPTLAIAEENTPSDQEAQPAQTEQAAPGDERGSESGIKTLAKSPSKAEPANAGQNTPSSPEKKNGLILEDGHLINYVDGAEKAISGWQKFEGSWYWFANSSRASESAWVEDSGSKYRV